MASRAAAERWSAAVKAPSTQASVMNGGGSRPMSRTRTGAPGWAARQAARNFWPSCRLRERLPRGLASRWRRVVGFFMAGLGFRIQ